MAGLKHEQHYSSQPVSGLKQQPMESLGGITAAPFPISWVALAIACIMMVLTMAGVG